MALSLSLALGAALVSPTNGQPGAPLPEQAAFLAAARARLVAGEVAVTRFSHKERSTELRLNPFARMGAGPTVLAEVFPSTDDDLTYRRILERDGRPVTDLADQDRRYRARLEGRRQVDDRQRARQEEAVRDTVELFTFTLEDRTTWQGEPAIVIRFVPKPDGQPRTRDARVASGFSGRAWVHEHDHELMHFEAQAVEDISFGFGLIGRLHKGSTVQLDKQRTVGVWLPSQIVFKGTGRVLLRWVDLDFRREYFDYRPFDPADLPARLR